MKKIWIVFVLNLMMVSGVHAQSVDYSQYEQILNMYVNEEGLVDYEGLLNNRSMLDEFIKEEIEETDIQNFSDNQKKAYWINTYNALTLKLIIDHYPPVFGQIRSINWGRPWDVKMRANGREMTLNEIEHDILRKWDPMDARIHFAINCASMGCPKLPNTHFAPATLDQQLEMEARKFNNDPEKVYLDRQRNRLNHSSIYKWFEEDFVAEHGSVKNYILQYINEEDKAYIQANEDKITLKAMKYDWGLNEQ